MKENNNTDSNNQQSFCTESQDKNKSKEKAKSILEIITVETSKMVIDKIMTPLLFGQYQYAYGNRENNANINANELLDGTQKDYSTNENIFASSEGSNRSNCFKHFWDYICCCKRKKPRSNKKFEHFISNENNIELNMRTQDKDIENCDDKILIDPSNTPVCTTNSDRDMSV